MLVLRRNEQEKVEQEQKGEKEQLRPPRRRLSAEPAVRLVARPRPEPPERIEHFNRRAFKPGGPARAPAPREPLPL